MLGLAEQRQTRRSEQEVPPPVTLIDKKKQLRDLWMMKKLIAEEVNQTYMERYLDVVPKSLNHYRCKCCLNNYD